MFKKILLPLDGSELAERVLETAMALAAGDEGSDKGELLLMRVPVAERMFVDYPAKYNILPPEQSFEYARHESKEYLEKIQQTRSRAGVSLRLAITQNTSLIEGEVAGSIVDTATVENVDLIAMSPHGRSGFTRWMLGSVTERVLRHTTRPVLIVRANKPIRRILIPLDGSELAEDALVPGLAVSQKLGCDIIFLRVEPLVVPDLLSIRDLEQTENGLGEQVREHFYQKAENYLTRLARPHRQAGQEIETLVTSGPAAINILEVAEAYDIDLIVMATHGRTGLSRWVYGSVTEKVMRGAHCSTLIIRPSALRLQAAQEKEAQTSFSPS